MNEKSIKTLEYYKIIEMLENFATSELGKKLCLSLKPYTDYNTIIKEQKETSDACDRIRTKGRLNFSGLKDVSASLKRLEIEASLQISELFYISKLLTLTKKTRDYGYHEDSDKNQYAFISPLDKYFTELEFIPSLAKELERCIISEDMLSDEASPALSKIRKQKRHINGNMHNELNSILHSHREYLMDAVITQRNGAYCLPIKAEFKNKVAGIVHDQSSTGSTVFIEPLAIIKLNNSLKELEIQESKETEKILAGLSLLISPHTETLKSNQTILEHLDFVYAKAGLSKKLSANEPVFNNKKYINIKDGRHPLLDKDKVVPINISLGKDYDLLIITGPNTGGKTVSLKTIGLFTLMGQAGLHIPAFSGSELAVFEDIFADIGDEQSIEQNLSTFSGHMTKIVDILAKADSNSLCLFDELGAGTDPTEGAALALSILSFLHRMETRTVATTHYSELKVFALNTLGVENASCEFDINTLKPTYRILVGVPGKSNAFAISSKLGLPDFIIDEAKSFIKQDDKSFEDLLIKLEQERIALEEEKNKVNSYKLEIEKLKKEYLSKDDKLKSKAEDIINKAKEEAVKILSEAKETADVSIKNINKIASSAGLGKALEAERESLRAGLKKNEIIKKSKVIKTKSSENKNLEIGDKVFVHSMNLEAVVQTLPNDKNKLFVQMGMLRTQVDKRDISIISPAKEESGKTAPRARTSFVKATHISPEVNVIGMNVDEACSVLDKYLDDALLSHLNSVRIIHGRGTGALQKGIHTYLKRQAYVKSFNLADFEDGGTAITIVNFK